MKNKHTFTNNEHSVGIQGVSDQSIYTRKGDKPYEYIGKPLTQEIAAKILFKWKETPELHISAWVENVKNYHISRGGLPAGGNLEQILRAAMYSVYRFGRAEGAGQWWAIRLRQKEEALETSIDQSTGTSTDMIYKHQGKILTREIASEIIVEIYTGGSPVNRKTIQETVFRYHKRRGGLPPKDEKDLPSIIRRALSHLRRCRCATKMDHSWNEVDHSWNSSWQIHEEDVHYDERDYPKILGKGSESVYLYYYPTFKQEAKANSQRFWKCKIGSTKREVSDRVEEQVKTAFPEHPIAALTIKTDEALKLERKIQGVLRILDKHIADAPGTEWFCTSPSQVESIYEFISSHSS